MFKKILKAARAHKIISAIVVVALAGGGYSWYESAHGSPVVTKYVVQAAAQGTVVVSVSGSGQVEPLTSVTVKPQNSGNVTKIFVTVGQNVSAGQLLVQLDPTNEQKAVSQANLNLQSAELALSKLQEAPATTTLQQDEDAVTQAEQTLAQASTTLQTDYESGFDSISGAFVDFQTVMLQLQDFVQGTDLSKGQANPDVLVNLMPNYLQASTTPYRDDVISGYQAAYAAYETNLGDYHAANRNSDPATLDALFAETYSDAKLIGNAVTSVEDMLNFMTSNYPSKTTGATPLPAFVTTSQTNFGNYVTSVNGDINTASNAVQTITSDKASIVDDQLSITEKQNSLTALQAGPDTLDVQSQQLSIEQQQMALQTAEENLANDSIRAPIGGVVSAIGAVVGEPVASSAVTLVAQGDVAQVTLNEIDAAKVSVGNKATLSFDAFPNLSIAGQVVEIDPVGTVSQGVVNYNVQVSFVNNATSTDQVKPGMSATANIVTQVDQNVIAVPNSAVKTLNGTSYVLEPAAPVPSSTLAAASANGGIVLPGGTTMVPVTVGISNDTLTEITSGVNVGDQIITQTLQSSGSAASGGTNALRLLGGGAGGAVRIGGGGAAAGRGGGG